MNQVYHIFKKLLLNLHINVPDSVIRHMLDIPTGNTLRGISDTLDSLNIKNDVYQLPKEYLWKLEFPYLVIHPDQEKTYDIITNEKDREKVLHNNEAIVLTAKKTNKTPIYKYVWLRNLFDRIKNNRIHIIWMTLVISYLFFYQPNFIIAVYVLLNLFGLWISAFILKLDYSTEGVSDKYCKIGKHINCEIVLRSRGSRFFDFFRLSDMAFLFFSTMLLLILIHNNGWHEYSILMLMVGCCFTIYSVAYQLMIIHKICLYCMSINIIIWVETFLLFTIIESPVIHNPYNLVYSGLVAYILWHIGSLNYHQSNKMFSLKKRLSLLYKREIFDWFLSQEREIEDIDDLYADIYGEKSSDIITMYVHPKCKICQKIHKVIPELCDKAKIKVVSLDSNNPIIHDYCIKNRINKTPTISFNGKELPRIYSIEDLRYIL